MRVPLQKFWLRPYNKGKLLSKYLASSSFSRQDATLRRQSRTSSLRPLLRMLARRDEQPLVKGNEDAGYECATRGEKPFPFPSSMRVHVIPTSKRQMALLPLILLEKNQQQDDNENVNETIASIRKTITVEPRYFEVPREMEKSSK